MKQNNAKQNIANKSIMTIYYFIRQSYFEYLKKHNRHMGSQLEHDISSDFKVFADEKLLRILAIFVNTV